jgi:hypothetical protein
MPFPWSLALRAIPWGALIAEAPTLARAAESLLARTKTRPPDDAPAAGLAPILARLDALEQQTRAHAELVTHLTQQTAALTTATEVLAARLRWLLGLGIAAVVLAATALIMAALA